MSTITMTAEQLTQADLNLDHVAITLGPLGEVTDALCDDCHEGDDIVVDQYQRGASARKENDNRRLDDKRV